MAMTDVLRKFATMSGGEIDRAIKSAWNDYTRLLAEVAHDIYYSCIQEFYTTYTPKVYKRHGYPEGKNLYRADDVMWSEHELRIKTAAENLWPYSGKKDKRSKVLEAVIKGKRGSSRLRHASLSDWPLPWYTNYPNVFSDYDVWNGPSGNKVTMQQIMDYFIDNVLTETEELFWECLDKYV